MAEAQADFAAQLERARGGDTQALAELAQRYEPEVRIVAHVLLGPALRPYLDSVDLVQSVHRVLLTGLRDNQFEVSSPERLVALALTLVRRKVARHWRRLQRQKRLSAGPATPSNLVELLLSLSKPQANPLQAAQYRDELERLCRHLDEQERRILALRLEGYSTAEAARQLGQDPDVLRVRLGRLRKRLREHGVLSECL